ncbi:DUF4352 domain-containing protein [Nonomuraea sp. RK-328]|nr:DUF4352 domain-containing protein [Nonomuraea sp. RK-328]
MVLIVIGVVVLLLFGGCAALVVALGSNSAPRSATVAEQDAGDGAAANEEPKGDEGSKGDERAGLGAEVRDGKFAFTVTKVDRQARLGSDLIGTDAQGVFLLVHITVKNIGDEAQAFTSVEQKLHAAGKEYEADAGAAIYLKDSKSLYEKINPGNSVQGVIVFDVPKDLKPDTLELHDSMFSAGVKVSLAGG